MQLHDACQLLACERRVDVVDIVKQTGPTTKRELSELIADREYRRENGDNGDEAPTQHRQRVYIALHQTHLGQLEKRGVIQCDWDRGTVKPGDRFDELARVHSTLREVMT